MSHVLAKDKSFFVVYQHRHDVCAIIISLYEDLVPYSARIMLIYDQLALNIDASIINTNGLLFRCRVETYIA